MPRATGLAELAYLFRSVNKSRPLLLLGAGASYRSGIPLAADAVRMIASAAFARHVRGVDHRQAQLTPSDWLPFLQRQTWYINDPKRFSENFPLAVQNLLSPREFRRLIFQEIIRPPNGINEGYRQLAQLMLRRLCWTVLTTNFDHLLVDALEELHPHIPDVVEINQTPDDLVRFQGNNRCQVVYLHGAVEFYQDKNLVDEIRRLDERLVRQIRPLLSQSPLIVIGYRGAEASVMDHLLAEGISECANYRYGIYWCLKRGDDPHSKVSSLMGRLGSNFRLIEIDGFDELMRDLNLELKDDHFQSTADTFDLPTSAKPLSFDQLPMDGMTLENLDRDLILSTFTTYCTRLNLPLPDYETCVGLLSERGLLRKGKDGTLTPSKGGFLLFGKNVQELFPHASVALTRDGKRRTVFEGNLVSQLQRLRDAFSTMELNPILRIKGEQTAEEKPAYPQRAILELIVNMLAHRDYSVPSPSRVDLVSGDSIRFTNPGGLLPRVKHRVRIEADGRFHPVRSITELRNPLLADIFYGLGPMDKQGTGLADVHDLMVEHGGSSEFAIVDNNLTVSCLLKQPHQPDPARSPIARRLGPTEVFITNLLPFRVLPRSIYLLPMAESQRSLGAVLSNCHELEKIPIVISADGNVLSFADLSKSQELINCFGSMARLQEIPVSEFLSSEDKRRRFVWLLGKHWEFYLRKLKRSGLTTLPHDKVAYFGLLDQPRNVIVYQSRTGKRVQREVVKPRGEDRPRWHENEGIHYAIVSVGGQWALQIKPFYMFTAIDGVTPLPAFRQSRLSTSRMKFDRNKNVEDDLTFWAKFLSQGQSTISLGGVGVEDFILVPEYTSVEVAAPESDEREDTSNPNT